MTGNDFLEPQEDKHNNILLQRAFINDTHSTFIAERDLYTGDGKDFIIELDETFTMNYQYGHMPWHFHKIWGQFSIRIDSQNLKI